MSQVGEDREEHPVAYVSRTLNVYKRNYTVTEKEFLEVIYACKQFQVYIHSTKFTVVTDHASLSWLSNLKEPEERLARWAHKLQAYNYKTVHWPGKKHQNADCLSRLPVVATLSNVADNLYKKMITDMMEDKPEEVQKILRELKKDIYFHKGKLYKI